MDGVIFAGVSEGCVDDRGSIVLHQSTDGPSFQCKLPARGAVKIDLFCPESNFAGREREEPLFYPNPIEASFAVSKMLRLIDEGHMCFGRFVFVTYAGTWLAVSALGFSHPSK